MIFEVKNEYLYMNFSAFELMNLRVITIIFFIYTILFNS